jgi:hypothetical protein
MRQEKNSNYADRESKQFHDMLGMGSIRYKLEWHKQKVTDDGFHFHCWLPKSVSEQKRNEMLSMFKKLAPMHGPALSFSWDFIPSRRRKKQEVESSED